MYRRLDDNTVVKIRPIFKTEIDDTDVARNFRNYYNTPPDIHRVVMDRFMSSDEGKFVKTIPNFTDRKIDIVVNEQPHLLTLEAIIMYEMSEEEYAHMLMVTK